MSLLSKQTMLFPCWPSGEVGLRYCSRAAHGSNFATLAIHIINYTYHLFHRCPLSNYLWMARRVTGTFLKTEIYSELLYGCKHDWLRGGLWTWFELGQCICSRHSSPVLYAV